MTDQPRSVENFKAVSQYINGLQLTQKHHQKISLKIKSLLT